MIIQHHPSEETLLGYAGGALPGPLASVVAMHFEVCLACRAELSLWEKVGGAFLEAMAPAEMTSNALERIFARLGEPVREPAEKKSRERWIGPGIWYTPLVHDKDQGTRLYRLRARAGTKLPTHGHDGRELTYVLTGEIADGDRRYGPGDFLEADATHEHEPRVSGDTECVCVIGSEGPPRIPGIAGLLLRAFF
ncbi:MAG: hypothetical protein RJB62_1748 [Pseudomonadota bacterium]|jgi:putative transcriptional regulator